MNVVQRLLQLSPASFKQPPKTQTAPSSTPYRICSSRKPTKLPPKPTRHQTKPTELLINYARSFRRWRYVQVERHKPSQMRLPGVMRPNFPEPGLGTACHRTKSTVSRFLCTWRWRTPGERFGAPGGSGASFNSNDPLRSPRHLKDA